MGKRIRNIGPEGQRRRLYGGLIALALGIAGLAVLLLTNTSRWWRLALFPAFWQGALGVFQAMEKT